VKLELISCEKQTYVFFKISSSYFVEASSYVYKKVLIPGDIPHEDSGLFGCYAMLASKCSDSL